ncbi:UNVERIFIED_CONTAM: hypothetical protein NY603_24030, partial [Bacteroidetes bacterium 56_B9]
SDGGDKPRVLPQIWFNFREFSTDFEKASVHFAQRIPRFRLHALKKARRVKRAHRDRFEAHHIKPDCSAASAGKQR